MQKTNKFQIGDICIDLDTKIARVFANTENVKFDWVIIEENCTIREDIEMYETIENMKIIWSQKEI